MIPGGEIRRMACVVLGVSLLFACSRPDPKTEKEPVTEVAANGLAISSSGMVFDLSPTEKELLSERALQGDAEASFRLAQFYGFSGGDGDPNINDEHDRQQEMRWLELAAQQGHPVGEFNFAVELAKDDCPRARSIMSNIRDKSPDTRRGKNAAYWLRNEIFAC